MYATAVVNALDDSHVLSLLCSAETLGAAHMLCATSTKMARKAWGRMQVCFQPALPSCAHLYCSNHSSYAAL